MYEAVLFLLLVSALVKPDARPFAAVMVANWVVNYIVAGQYGLYAWVSAVDGAAFIALGWLTLRHPRWWSFLIAELTFLSVAVHAAYWLCFGLGLYFGPQYQIVLNGAFILSALILVIGGYDLGRLVGSVFNRIAHAAHLRGRRLDCVRDVARRLTKDAK